MQSKPEKVCADFFLFSFDGVSQAEIGFVQLKLDACRCEGEGKALVVLIGRQQWLFWWLLFSERARRSLAL
jgi:hypothetical protein